MKLITWILWLICASLSSSYRGLVITTWGTKSHENFYLSVINSLVQRGHKITYVTPHKSELKTENVTQVILKEDFTKKIIENPFTMDGATFAANFMTYVPTSCTASLTDPGVVEALKHDYDYFILQLLFTECFLTIPNARKIPFIYATPNTLTVPDPVYIGVPDFLSITPSRVRDITYPFSFCDRLILVVDWVLAKFFMDYLSKLTYNKAVDENLWSSDSPDVFDLKQESSLTIINSVRALEYPMRAVPPKVIYAGGIHIKEPQPLPKDLSAWLDGSGDEGFIFFSLGTGIKPEHVDPYHLSAILDVFGSLKQKVLWKWASEIENLPPNVKIMSWLPQQDLLAHPNIKLLISHGGLFSVQEATYFGVPFLGIPIYYDQIMNVAEIVEEGWGRSIQWGELTKESLYDAIQDVLTNTSVREVVKRRSLLMRDIPRTPKDEVAFWVEYVIRHKGAEHLRSPFVGMSWYKIYNIDVWIFITVSSIAIFNILFNVIKFFVKFCTKKLCKIKQE